MLHLPIAGEAPLLIPSRVVATVKSDVAAGFAIGLGARNIAERIETLRILTNGADAHIVAARNAQVLVNVIEVPFERLTLEPLSKLHPFGNTGKIKE